MKKQVVKEESFKKGISFDFKKIIMADIALNSIFLVMGLIIYLNPLMLLSTVGIMMGIYFMIFGMFDIYEYLKREEVPIFNYHLFLGIIAILLGLFVIFNPFKMIKILTIVLGLYLVVVAIFKGLEAGKLKKVNYDGWKLMLVIAIILLIFGVFIIINPMASMDLAEATGIFIILSSILEVCNLFMIYGKAKEIEKLFQN